MNTQKNVQVVKDFFTAMTHRDGYHDTIHKVSEYV